MVVQAKELGVEFNSQSGRQLLEASGVLASNVVTGLNGLNQSGRGVREVTDGSRSQYQHSKQTSI